MLRLLPVFLLTACSASADGLDSLHADIEADYPSVAHVTADTLPATPLYLDIREPSEFAVSRLPGAVLAPPGTSIDALLAEVRGRDVVVYCSVGRRSSIFARDVQAMLIENGATSVANLEGGIFGWHGERRALEDADGPTDVVHPYDAVWKQYVPRQDAARYLPE